MFSFLSFVSNLEITLAVGVGAFIAGVVFSQKTKDWFKGVPTELRAALKGVEADTLAKVKAAQAVVISELPKLPSAKVALPASSAAPITPALSAPVSQIIDPAAPIPQTTTVVEAPAIVLADKPAA